MLSFCHMRFKIYESVAPKLIFFFTLVMNIVIHDVGRSCLWRNSQMAIKMKGIFKGLKIISQMFGNTPIFLCFPISLPAYIT